MRDTDYHEMRRRSQSDRTRMFKQYLTLRLSAKLRVSKIGLIGPDHILRSSPSASIYCPPCKISHKHYAYILETFAPRSTFSLVAL